MKFTFKLLFSILIISLIASCKSYNNDYEKDTHQAKYIHTSMKKLSDVIIHDIFSPPVASRNYMYPSVAAYEAGRHMDSSYVSLVGQLNGLEKVTAPSKDQTYDFAIASTTALLHTAKHFIFSEEKIQEYDSIYLEEIKELNINPDILNASIAYGKQVSSDIISWSNGDNYKQTRSYPKYAVEDNPERWKPTPPAYMEGIEPHWREIRPVVIDSADQFTPEVPTTFSLDKESKFYEEVMEVYTTVNNLDEEQNEIASFWDCNPYVLNVTGHVMHASKKITPGGHWIGIVKIACEKDNADFMKTVKAYTLTSLTLIDGFISCWDEKYRSNLTRPETYINEYIDNDWLPTLQTPPFPEYTSGHSVISTAAAVALTSIFGENFAFRDDTEVEFGLPVRNFDSFYDASSEAAISRLYGGIHYRPAIENGVKQGRKLGQFIVQQINFQEQS